MGLLKPLPLLYQFFLGCKVSTDDGLRDRLENLFEGYNAIIEDFSEARGVRKVAPGETL